MVPSHRIGRTGRGGRSGQSVTFFTGENHERALAGELMRVLRDSGFEAEGLKKFPMTVKKSKSTLSLLCAAIDSLSRGTQRVWSFL